jgi:hypothetical protein
MSEISFCDPCHAFLKGSWTRTSNDLVTEYKHHHNAESFRSALQVKCAICLRLWAAFGRGYDNNIYSYKDFDAREPWPLFLGPTIFEHPMCLHNCPVVHFRLPEHQYHARLELSSLCNMLESQSKAVSSSTGDDVALDFLLLQYEQCVQHHTMCLRPVTDPDFHPTRLIDVGTRSDALIHLCERESLPTGAPYISLSHCWGNVRPTTLTTSSAASLKKGFPVASLPRTFQDAIAVTRRFHHRYLWIDSL